MERTTSSYGVTGEQTMFQNPSFNRYTAPAGAHSPDLFIVGAALSIGASLALRAMGRRADAHFVGQWAPTLLVAGLYTRGESRILNALRRRLVDVAPPAEQVM
jgi:hypothetical protein